MEMEIKRFQVNLDPTIGHEIKKRLVKKLGTINPKAQHSVLNTLRALFGK